MDAGFRYGYRAARGMHLSCFVRIQLSHIAYGIHNFEYPRERFLYESDDPVQIGSSPRTLLIIVRANTQNSHNHRNGNIHQKQGIQTENPGHIGTRHEPMKSTGGYEKGRSLNSVRERPHRFLPFQRILPFIRWYRPTPFRLRGLE